jgi:hypothetical protein
VLPVARDVVRAIGVHVAVVLHDADVRAGGERLVAAGDHHAADAVVGVELLQRLAQLLHELRVERVQLLRAVERNKGDAGRAALVDEDQLIAHGSG